MILGVDFGLRRIGLALADEEGVEPLAVVGNTASVLKKIAKICRQYQVSQIVLGLPEGRLVPSVKKFGQGLKQTTGLAVIFQDESLTSKDALDKMIMLGKKQKARQQKDAVAAALILENYCQQKRNV